jgi:hypothetical protein
MDGRWLLDSEPRVRIWVTLCKIRGGRGGTGAGFSVILFYFPLLMIIPQVIRTHLLPPPQVYSSPDQTAHYHILGL